jgi:hypothetical protein
MASFESMSEVKQNAPALMSQLVDQASGQAPFNDLKSVIAVLHREGFSRTGEESFGPPGGRQLFYTNCLVQVRIKTRGDARGPRANQPHLSVSVTDGVGTRWFNDVAKLNAQGQLAAKSFTSAERFRPIDHDNNPQRFVMIQGGQAARQDEGVFDEWAARTHFNFPPGFLDVEE